MTARGRILLMCGACLASYSMIRKKVRGGQWRMLKFTPLRAAEQLLPDLESIKDNVKKDQLVTWEKLSSLAAIGVSSSVASLVEITASQMIETEKLYQKYLETLIDVVKAYSRSLGSANEEQLWTTISFLRSNLAEISAHRRNIHLLWMNCQALADNSGQATFITGAEGSACRLAELQSSCTNSINSLTRATELLLAELAKAEVEEIRASSERQRNNDTTSEQQRNNNTSSERQRNNDTGSVHQSTNEENALEA